MQALTFFQIFIAIYDFYGDQNSCNELRSDFIYLLQWREEGKMVVIFLVT